MLTSGSLSRLCSVHSIARWERDRVVSFVPPDGQFKLMSYRCVCSAAGRRCAVPDVVANTIGRCPTGVQRVAGEHHTNAAGHPPADQL